MTDFLKNNLYFVFFLLASLIMQVGIGLTQIAVYGELVRLNANPIYFTIAFSLAVFPGLFSSRLGNYFTFKFNVMFLILGAQALGFISLIIPFLGASYHQIIFLISAEFISSFIAGLCYPAFQIYIKRVFFNDEILPLAAKLDVYVFSVNTIIGTGIGAIMYNLFSTPKYLAMNMLCYILSFIIFTLAFCLKKDHVQKISKIELNKKYKSSIYYDYLFYFKNMGQEKRYAFFMMIYIAIIATPSISLLPIIGNKFGSNVTVFGLVLTPAILFILSKAIGQMCGPLFIKNNMFNKIYNSKFLFFSFMLLFLLLYTFLYFSNYLFLSLVIIIFAHIFSNIIFALGMYAFQKSFSSDEIGLASSKQYQILTLSMAFISVITGFLVNYITPIVLIYIPFCLIVCAFMVKSKFSKKWMKAY
jgi:MFS transporter, DHA3 family, macrolide efflux protein